jgi:predicted metal-dependent hydrolase
MTVLISQRLGVIESKEAFETALTAGLEETAAVKYAAYFAKKTKVKATGRTARKDSGMTKVYRSEWKLERQFPEIRAKMSQKDVVKYFDRIVKSKTYQALCEKNTRATANPTLKIMKDMGGRSRIAGRATYLGELELSPSTGFNKYVIIHELAHLCGNMHHDVSFRQDLLKLVSRFLGVEVAKQLKANFKENKLKMTVSQTVKAPLEWFESYKKMAAIRSQKGV